MSFSVRARGTIEREIAKAFIKQSIAAGYTITVCDGEEDVLKKSTDEKAILKAMFSTDEDILYVHRDDKNFTGWVRFTYGNDGWDVISDYTINVEHLMSEATKVSDKYQ